MSTYARPLADRLAAASDAQLERLLRDRRVSPDAAWDDFFDAAEALLEVPSIERALAALPRADALDVRRAVDSAPDAAGIRPVLGLVYEDGTVPQPVAAAVTGQPEIPDIGEHSPARSPATVEARAAERAFTTIGALADLLLATRSAPLALVASGGISATEKRRLADGGQLDDLRALAETAGLAHPVDRELRITRSAETWLTTSFCPRWTAVADAFRRSLPEGIRSGGGWTAPGTWAAAYPWDPAWPARAEQLLRLADLLGLVAVDGSEPSWAQHLRAGDAADAQALQSLLPTEVDRLFVQNDLTAIAPGPLLPALDNRLRAMTEHESTAQASSYRFTADSIARALIEGETAESILDFLGAVSLTGVPQPLAYLVAQTADRHGLVRVGPDATGSTRVSSTDAHLLAAIEVDRNLRPIGLVREGGQLTSRVGAEAVAWALTDARYPATLVDRDGATIPGTRVRLAPERSADLVSYAPLIARLRSRQGPDADAAWLDRELEAAVRARAVVLVEVAMPDGTSRELTLEASGMGGGRLRGRDRTADVERTLPVRSIRSVQVLST